MSTQNPPSKPNHSDVTIRRAEETDIPKLVAALTDDIHGQQIFDRWREDRSGDRKMYVAVLDGDVVGTISTSRHRYQMPNSVRMFALNVGRNFRRRGFATALIRFIEEEARSTGHGRTNLEVLVDNAAAIRLYEGLGYMPVGDPVVNRWSRVTNAGNREDVEQLSWVMVKDL